MTGSAERNGAGEGERTGIWMTGWEKRVWIVVKSENRSTTRIHGHLAYLGSAKATQRHGAFYSIKTVSYLRAAGLLVW